jgi:hypothetical protein
MSSVDLDEPMARKRSLPASSVNCGCIVAEAVKDTVVVHLHLQCDVMMYWLPNCFWVGTRLVGRHCHLLVSRHYAISNIGSLLWHCCFGRFILLRSRVPWRTHNNHLTSIGCAEGMLNLIMWMDCCVLNTFDCPVDLSLRDFKACVSCNPNCNHFKRWHASVKIS